MQAAPNIEGRLWRHGKPQHNFDSDKISSYLGEPDALVWIDLCDPDHDTMCELATELGLNQWAVEDAMAAAERVKATAYQTHTFFTVYSVDVASDLAGDRASDWQRVLSMHRISAFVLP